jgi:hypothetical protein
MTPEQVKANAASEWIPPAAELAEIDQIVPPRPAARREDRSRAAISQSRPRRAARREDRSQAAISQSRDQPVPPRR